MFNRSGAELKKKGFTPKTVARCLKERRRPEPQPRRETRNRERNGTGVDLVVVFKVVSDIFSTYSRHRRSEQEIRNQELDELVLHLARQYKGIVGVADLLMRGEYRREEAEATFGRLERRGQCLFLCEYEGERVYVFPAYLARVWHCSYCDSTFPAHPHHRGDENLHCCNCGACMDHKIAEEERLVPREEGAQVLRGAAVIQ